MSNVNEEIRSLLEDVQQFFTSILPSETLTPSAITHREGLVTRLHKFLQDYPHIKDPLGGSEEKSELSPLSASPPPYLEMKGQMPPQFPTLEGLPPNIEEQYYEEYGSEIVMVTPEKLNLTYDNKSLGESEDTTSEEVQTVPEIAASDLTNAEKNGYLEKKGKERLGGLLNPFQRRWCAIKNSVLYYYVNQNDRKQKGHLDLNGYEARPQPTAIKDPSKKNFCFEIVCPGKPTYQFIALTVKDMKQWIAAVERQNQDLLPNFQPTIAPNVILQSKTPERASMWQPAENPENVSIRPPIEKPVEVQPTLYNGNDDTDDELYECVGEHKNMVEEQEELYEEGESWGGTQEPEEVYVDADAEESFKPENWYVGLWDCSGSGELELDFKRGELIQIIDKTYDKDAWWMGKLGSKVGLVPKAYLMEAYEQDL